MRLLPPRDLRLTASATRTTRSVPLAEDEPEIRAALESLRAATVDDSRRDRSIASRLAAFVQRVLDQLPSHYADALEWKYIDEVPVQEIASRLGLGAKAAESLLTQVARVRFARRSGRWQRRRSPPFPDPATLRAEK